MNRVVRLWTVRNVGRNQGGSRQPPMTLGVDVGATSLRAVIVDTDGRLLDHQQRATDPERGPSALVDDLVDDFRRYQRTLSEPIQAVGLGVAGQVERTRGRLRAPPNIPWEDVPLGRLLRERLPVPVVVSNDVDAATWGEWSHGAGRDTEHLLGVFVGTGVGVGAISGGRMVEGCTASALEFGHVTVEEGGRVCSCRNHGCLEAYVGGWALAERAREAVRDASSRGDALMEAAGSMEALHGRHVAECFRDGDPLATELVEETARYLATGLVGMVNVLHPCVLVLGGGVIEGLPTLVERVKTPLAERCFPVFSESLQVRASELKSRAAAVGAAARARQCLAEEG